ncbi:GNAT family N-acetyltransferase [Caenispirillum salinarum]|uniref:GNAT family N-acetyltransferase n=1 Tax=Caenispirillum salinarum TaxID=859058 RepID=UPI0038511580
MPDGRNDSLTLKAVASIAAVPADAWDACAGTGNPFVRHAFLSALEDSRSACGEEGWLPRHLVLEDPDGGVLACAPLYVKSHSYGEYVFDWSWANAYSQAGGRYYPKLQCAVPFTPVTGPRLLVRPDAPDPARLREALVGGMVNLAERAGCSSVHVTFPTEAEAETMEGMGLLRRMGVQYHWENPGYGSFDEFLETLSSRKRKDIRKERARAQASGVRLETLTGDAITPRHWDAFHRFYMATSDRKWGNPYLTREFFDLLGQRMGDAVVLVMGFEDDRPVCGALNLRGSDTLYGRNWGSLGDYRYLHFEACYYRALDFAIEHGLTRVEAGAQGEHKIKRGYMPRPTWSAHWIADAGLRQAVERYLGQERAVMQAEIEDLATLAPYKKTGDAAPDSA